MNVKRYVRIYFLSIARAYMTDLEYRANFVASVSNTLFSLASTLIFFNIIYFRAKEIGVWSKYELLLLLGVYLFIKGVFEFTIRKGLDRLPRYVRKGTLDGVLVKPLSSLFQVTISKLDFDDISQMLVSVLLISYSLPKLVWVFSWVYLLAFLLVLFCATLILFANYLMIMTTTFYFTRIHHEEIYKNLFQMTRIPMDIYPRKIQFIFTYIIPLAFFVTIPAKTLLGRLDPAFIIIAPVFAALNIYLSVKFWNYSLRYYKSASG